ncbi:MAG TPA: SUMF1/EgtB/PvdO family nonheme iron enzyme, partial [Caldimonas sp.]|nr:SUMF1/EgtB/PvdO family nonheme iron enzyme [Caldimonas sp.]
ILRGPHALRDDGLVDAARPPRIAGPDAVFDSARLGHDVRWGTPLPARAELLGMLERQLDACIDAIPPSSDDAALYFHRLSLFHEDMHGEAFAWLRATLEWPAPDGVAALRSLPEGGSLRIDACDVVLGRGEDEAGFSFDNEQPKTPTRVAAFEIDRAPLSAGAFARFVDAGGYDDAALWPGAAGLWRAQAGRAQPLRWRRAAAGGWESRWFDRWLPLDAGAPLIHVNAWEAEAYCRWAGRRLPTAAEWQAAARQPRFHWGGSVWEWTASAFEPYPGFRAGPYSDYSRPWFGDHRELRGGSFATHPRLHDLAYRNFFTPERADVFAGFRTVAMPS